MFNRRSVLAGGLAMAAAPSLARIAQAQSGKPMLVFVGHEQWGGCKIWRAQSEPDFVKSDACKKLDYRIVHPADLTGILKEENWPKDALWVRTAFLESDEGKARPEGTPRFILAQDGRVILAVTGNAGWKEKMWPKILEVTGSKA